MCIHTPLPFKFHSHLDHHRVLNRVPWCYSTCYLFYLFYTYTCIFYTCIIYLYILYMYNIPVYLYNIRCIIYLYLLYIYLLSILYIVVYICKSFSIFEFNSVQINHFYLSVEISISHYYVTLKLLNTGTVCPCRPALQGTFCSGSLAWPDHTAGLPCPLGFSRHWPTGEMEQKRQEEREVGTVLRTPHSRPVLHFWVGLRHKFYVYAYSIGYFIPNCLW